MKLLFVLLLAFLILQKTHQTDTLSCSTGVLTIGLIGLNSASCREYKWKLTDESGIEYSSPESSSAYNISIPMESACYTFSTQILDQSNGDCEYRIYCDNARVTIGGLEDETVHLGYDGSIISVYHFYDAAEFCSKFPIEGVITSEKTMLTHFVYNTNFEYSTEMGTRGSSFISDRFFSITEPGEYRLVSEIDSYWYNEDRFDCRESHGYTLSINGQDVFTSNGMFGSYETITFTVNATGDVSTLDAKFDWCITPEERYYQTMAIVNVFVGLVGAAFLFLLVKCCKKCCCSRRSTPLVQIGGNLQSQGYAAVL